MVRRQSRVVVEIVIEKHEKHEKQRSAVLGLYLHIPFCAKICNYCNFNRGLLDAAVKRRYVDALISEIRAASEPATAVDTVFFGGGTPSVLDVDEVAQILDACRESFALAGDNEITFEANPESVTETRLSGYRAAGVNRVSFGVQSFDDNELGRLGRAHSADTARKALADARAAGFDQCQPRSHDVGCPNSEWSIGCLLWTR